MTNSPLFNQLLEILRVLSLDPEGQMNYLKNQGLDGEISEIALMYEDAFLLVPGFVKAGFLHESNTVYLKQIYEKVSYMSNFKDQWTRDGLRYSNEWLEIRSLAAKCLDEIAK